MIDDVIPAPIAAIVHDGTAHTDDLMLEIVRCLRAEGWRLGGLVQHNIAKTDDVCTTMVTEDLASGRKVTISLARAPGAGGCRLDPAGLAEAAALAAKALMGGVDLVVISKFGRQEAEGRGLRAEIGLAVAEGLPILTSVQSSLKEDWTAFAGDVWTELPPDANSVLDWCRSIRSPARRAMAGPAAASPARHVAEPDAR